MHQQHSNHTNMDIEKTTGRRPPSIPVEIVGPRQFTSSVVSCWDEALILHPQSLQLTKRPTQDFEAFRQECAHVSSQQHTSYSPRCSTPLRARSQGQQKQHIHVKQTQSQDDGFIDTSDIVDLIDKLGVPNELDERGRAEGTTRKRLAFRPSDKTISFDNMFSSDSC